MLADPKMLPKWVCVEIGFWKCVQEGRCRAVIQRDTDSGLWWLFVENGVFVEKVIYRGSYWMARKRAAEWLCAS